MGMCLSAQPPTLWVMQRFEPDCRGSHLAQYIDLEALAVFSQRGRHITRRQAFADAMAVGSRRYVADRGAVLEDRLVADHIGIRVRDFHDDEAALRARGPLGARGGAAAEVGFVEVDKALQAGFA